MSWERDKKKKLAEYLWTEINKAILKSPDVQISIKKLQKLELLDYVSEYNLVLEVDKLIESILKKNVQKEIKADSILEELHIHAEPENDQEEKETPDLPSSPEPAQWVDGKALSENEVRFEEYFNQQFDEKHWMKKAKIRFDN
ncbi:MAG: hypothetical protein HOI59_10720 [Nitrospina sp.]|jgi:hypothetical protein|nr:hypothetical protein [Nitrospina sp.]MBT3415611.1 hypothetical protein [Nitrospina sp.]MBT3858036.1 hypothetical protein [Nitrospina sp.]MBT4105888.1 hypothetical protein [Nitrospina sp.]MBT4390035.1 hypothetical protein [Nitrospina sp.]